MAEVELAYAKANETPGWERVQIFDLDTGKMLSRVVEADATAGFYRHFVLNRRGRLVHDPEQPDQLLVRRTQARIRIILPEATHG